MASVRVEQFLDLCFLHESKKRQKVLKVQAERRLAPSLPEEGFESIGTLYAIRVAARVVHAARSCSTSLTMGNPDLALILPCELPFFTKRAAI